MYRYAGMDCKKGVGSSAEGRFLRGCSAESSLGVGKLTSGGVWRRLAAYLRGSSALICRRPRPRRSRRE